jgi:hypothetical protein
MAVRFAPTKTDNQSAGKLRLGFQPWSLPSLAVAHAPSPVL